MIVDVLCLHWQQKKVFTKNTVLTFRNVDFKTKTLMSGWHLKAAHWAGDLLYVEVVSLLLCGWSVEKINKRDTIELTDYYLLAMFAG